MKLDPNALTVTVAPLVSTGAAVALAAGQTTLGALLILAGGFFDLVDGSWRGTAASRRASAPSSTRRRRRVDAAPLVGVSVHFARVGAPQYVALAGLGRGDVPGLVQQGPRRLAPPSFEIGLL